MLWLIAVDISFRYIDQWMQWPTQWSRCDYIIPPCNFIFSLGKTKATINLVCAVTGPASQCSRQRTKWTNLAQDEASYVPRPLICLLQQIIEWLCLREQYVWSSSRYGLARLCIMLITNSTPSLHETPPHAKEKHAHRNGRKHMHMVIMSPMPAQQCTAIKHLCHRSGSAGFCDRWVFLGP